jgi:predicted component of type VI protein secretion system
MAASEADTPTNPEASLRASDAERDEAARELGDRYAEGRLSQETFLRRMDEAFGAKDRGQLDGLFTDLPRQGASRSLRALRDTLRASLQDGARRLRPPARPAVPGAAPSEPARALFLPPTGPGAPASFSIGRDGGCDLLIEHSTVSRWHARLDRVDGGWILADAGSTNGTRVNGWRVRQPTPVHAGDHVMFGSATFIVCVRDS